ncbi:signal recognition particle-docking protein FtsY, partial [candidate division WOR-3 bacterium]|nr:signal recognition particle-docking protein FtsY [candidate division WOR-3 bacterium]
EEALLAADIGVRVTELLVAKVKHAGADRQHVLQSEIARILQPPAGNRQPGVPLVVLVVGVNGSGKTTTVGKLCRHLSSRGRKVVVAAADTYRDAAAAQLGVWAGRAGVEVVLSRQGQDAAAVAFDAIQKAQAGGADAVLVDTAGRLHTRKDLMDEVVKIRRVCGKARAGAPDEVWLVLDATVGQNGIRQAQVFGDALGLTGIIVTKLDGTARGGVLIPIALELRVPIRFVGTGERLEDLEEFDPAAFARALFEE